MPPLPSATGMGLFCLIKVFCKPRTPLTPAPCSPTATHRIWAMYERKPASSRGVVQPQVARRHPGIVGDRAFDRAAGRDQGTHGTERIQQCVVEGGGGWATGNGGIGHIGQTLARVVARRSWSIASRLLVVVYSHSILQSGHTKLLPNVTGHLS